MGYQCGTHHTGRCDECEEDEEVTETCNFKCPREDEIMTNKGYAQSVKLEEDKEVKEDLFARVATWCGERSLSEVVELERFVREQYNGKLIDDDEDLDADIKDKDDDIEDLDPDDGGVLIETDDDEEDDED